MKIDNKDTYFDDRVAVDLRKLLQEGKKQAETFWKDRLVHPLSHFVTILASDILFGYLLRSRPEGRSLKNL